MVVYSLEDHVVFVHVDDCLAVLGQELRASEPGPSPPYPTVLTERVAVRQKHGMAFWCLHEHY